jgi:Domain of unknown function (DUF4190)
MSSSTAQARRTDGGATASLVCGTASLIGLVFPPLIAAGIAAIVLGWRCRRRIARNANELKGTGIATAGLVFGVFGTLLSLVIPGFVAYVFVYAVFHGGQCPNNGC